MDRDAHFATRVFFSCHFKKNLLQCSQYGKERAVDDFGMKKMFAAAAMLLSCVVAFSACAPSIKVAFRDDIRFGTQIRWLYAREDDAAETGVWERLSEEAKRIEQSISGAGGSVERFNLAAAGDCVEIDETAYRILKLAQELYGKTQGAYNPATGLLVDLWGFSPRHRAADYRKTEAYDRDQFENELPAEKYIEAFSKPEMLDFGAVALREADGKYYAEKPEQAFVTVEGDEKVYTMQLNLGGIGKGYCADGAARILREADQTYGYYSLGGSSMIVLRSPASADGRWEIGIRSPRGQYGAEYAVLTADNAVISVSGDYEQFYQIDGRRYCHIIDPFTGYPAAAAPGQDGSRVASALVVGLSATEGDAVATALTVKGVEWSLAFAQAYEKPFGYALFSCDAQGECTVYSNLPEDLFAINADIAVERAA